MGAGAAGRVEVVSGAVDEVVAGSVSEPVGAGAVGGSVSAAVPGDGAVVPGAAEGLGDDEHATASRATATTGTTAVTATTRVAPRHRACGVSTGSA